MAAPSQMGAHNNYQGEGPNRGDGFRSRWNANVSDTFGGRPGEAAESGGGGSEIRDRGDGGRNVPGGEREHGHPERGNGTGSRDAKGSEQADPHQKDEDAADEVR
jgi:hypothetical protein